MQAVASAAEHGGRHGSHSENEVRAHVCVQLAQQAKWHGDWDGFFDVDVDALDFVFAQDGEEGVVVGVELRAEAVSFFVVVFARY